MSYKVIPVTCVIPKLIAEKAIIVNIAGNNTLNELDTFGGTESGIEIFFS